MPNTTPHAAMTVTWRRIDPSDGAYGDYYSSTVGDYFLAIEPTYAANEPLTARVELATRDTCQLSAKITARWTLAEAQAWAIAMARSDALRSASTAHPNSQPTPNSSQVGHPTASARPREEPTDCIGLGAKCAKPCGADGRCAERQRDEFVASVRETMAALPAPTRDEQVDTLRRFIARKTTNNGERFVMLGAVDDLAASARPQGAEEDARDAARWREIAKHLSAHRGPGVSTHVEAWLQAPFADSATEAVDRLLARPTATPDGPDA